MLGAGAVDFRLASGCDLAQLRRETERWKDDNLGAGIGHPDVWPGVIVKEPAELAGRRAQAASARKSPEGSPDLAYEELGRLRRPGCETGSVSRPRSARSN